MLSKIFRHLSSWWTTAGILLCIAISYMVFLFGETPYAAWTTFIFHKPAGILLYSALILNIFAAGIRIVLDNFTTPAISPESIQKMDVHAALNAEDAGKLDELTAFMAQKGFVLRKSGNSVHVRKNRYSFLPGTLARLGIIILLSAAIISAHARKSTETVLHEGDTQTFFGSQITLKSISVDLPGEFLQLGEEGSFMLRKVSGILQSSGAESTITQGFPLRMHGIWYRITHTGFTLPITISIATETVTKNLDLDILPPGKADIVPLPADEMFLTFSMHPSKTITKGLVKGREFNLYSPSYHIVIQKGGEKTKIGDFVMEENKPASLSPYSIRTGTHIQYIKIQAVSDPALPFIYTGALLALIGSLLMPVRLFWYEKELSATWHKNMLYIGYREEFFKKWGIEKFHAWMADFRQTEPE